jgi:hypothetical protein
MFFDPKSDFCEKIFANIFAMSAAVSPWGGGFESRFLAKSEICGFFLLYIAKIVFFGHTFFSNRFGNTSWDQKFVASLDRWSVS